MHVLVTGGTGFMGSHCVLELLQLNHTVTVISNLVNSATGVGESCRDPLKFYYSNIVGSLNLIRLCKYYNVKNIIFSSSAAVYGTTTLYPLKEEDAIEEEITNPYGQTKYMIEKMFKDITESDKDWNIICLRFSLVIGAHPSGIIGDDPKNTPNNLMPYISRVLTGKLPFLTIFGDNFNTPDGTSVRDYVHVMDASRACIFALNRIIKEKSIGFELYNIGSGKEFSVFEMIKAMENASGQKIPTKVMPPRPNDTEYICFDPTLASKILNWKAEFDLVEMCRDVVNWQQNNPKGYVDKEDKALRNG